MSETSVSASPESKVVVLLASYAPSLVNFRGDLIRARVAAGHQVVAVAPDIPDEIARALGAMGADVRSLKLERAGLNPLADASYYLGLRRLLANLQPDVLISYTIKPVAWGTLAASSLGIPARVAMITGLGFAFTEGGGAKRMIARTVARVLYSLALRRATSVIFQNPDDKALFSDIGVLPRTANVTIVNGSGVNTRQFEVAALPPGVSFLMIARLLGDKGVREYAAAAALVKARYPDIPIRLVGYRDDSPDCISQAELDEMIAGGVEFLGRMDDVRPAIAASSVYVLPSYREGTPRSVLEAMSMGRPVITTDVPGCRETVRDGVNGFLVPARDAEALAMAMIKLIEHEDLVASMGKRSREAVEAQYESGKVSRQIMAAAGLLAESLAE
jgi:glycosyltransferase involved in cell wall biosynthesis